MRKVLSVSAIGLALLILASCGSNPRAFLRIVHAAPGSTSIPPNPPSPSIDVTIDGNKVLSSVAYATGSNYFSVAPGARHFQINVTGDTTFLIDTTINLTDQTYTTMTLVGEIGAVASGFPIPPVPSITSSTDEHGAAAAGIVKIRAMNAAVGYDQPLPPPPAPQVLVPLPVDVYITTFGAVLDGLHPTLPSVNFQTTTAYVPIAVGDLEIRVVVPAGCGSNPLTCNPNNAANILIDSGKVTFTDKKQEQTYLLTDQTPPSPFFQGTLLPDVN